MKIDTELFRTVEKIAGRLLACIPTCRPTLVGGCVRDGLWHDQDPEIKDLDMEVFGATNEEIIGALEGYYDLEAVGRKFGVLKVKGHLIDIALPRRDIKTGEGHGDFNVVVDPELSLLAASMRRDFCMNAVTFDLRAWINNERPENQCYVDPYNGRAHILAKLIHPISAKFEEDPLRPLRAMQFIARFDLIPSHELVHRCRKMKDKLRHLPKERLQQEWNTLILKGRHIGKGLQFLVDTELIDLYPELKALIGVPQDPGHHPEGDVWVHNCLCLDAFAELRTGNELDDLVSGYAVLCHDLGKPATTRINHLTGRLCAHGHEEVGVPIARAFMERLFDPASDIIKMVERLVRQHMHPWRLYKDGCSLPALRRCSIAVDGRLDLLLQVVEADKRGCGGLREAGSEARDWIDEVVKTGQLELKEGPKAIVKGQHLIDHFHMQPGPAFSPILKAAFEAQLDGKITDEATGLAFVTNSLSAPIPSATNNKNENSPNSLPSSSNQGVDPATVPGPAPGEPAPCVSSPVSDRAGNPANI